MNMISQIECSRSRALMSRYPAMRFTAVIATEVSPSGLKKQAAAFAAATVNELKNEDQDRQLSLAEFERFFKAHKQPFPLIKQIASAASRGFPPVPGPVLALLALEASTGILMGVQDFAAVDKYITLDALPAKESFTGMRGEPIDCTPGEVVVRDRKSIIASLFQGPDKRTAVKPDSRNILFYVFDTDTGLDELHDRAVDKIVQLFPSGTAKTAILAAE